MPESALACWEIDGPAPGSTLPPGRHALRGWAWARAGGVIVDARARVGGKIFAGVHGLPRADIAAYFKTGRAQALAEFFIALELAPGPATVALEVLDLEGRWSPLADVTYCVTSAQPPVDFAVPSNPFSPLDFREGLLALLRAAAKNPGEAVGVLARRIAADIPAPRDLRHAPAPMLGYVDEPTALSSCRFGRIPAFGHLIHPTRHIRQVYGTVDLQAWQPLAYGQPTPALVEPYRGLPSAGACGFGGLVDVPAQLPNPVSLRIYAELDDGSLQLGPVVRTNRHTQEDEKLPLADGDESFFTATLKEWTAALAGRALAVERPESLPPIIAEIQAEFERRARGVPPAAVHPLALSPPSSSAPRPRRVLLVTHAFSLQGAPRFLLEYARFLAAVGVQLDVLTAEDGPLRAEFAALGARIAVADTADIFSATERAEVQVRATDATRGIDWTAVDLVVANTFTTFWAVHAARAAGRPVLLYVHESTTPATFYQRRVPPAVAAAAEEAFALAGAVSFTTASTRGYHLAYGRPERHRLTPGWVDLARLDAAIAAHDRERARAEFGLGPGEKLVCNIGTVSDRKGQHTFARAAHLFSQRYPELAARTRFILLGGRDGPFDRMLQESLAELSGPHLVVHPETTDYLKYYLAADVFACSSYEESSPRVIFEAMACRVPILASAVQGIPELVRPDLEAMLLPAGHTTAWCEGLARVLATPLIGSDLARRARVRVEEEFDVARTIPRHLALAADVAARKAD